MLLEGVQCVSCTGAPEAASPHRVGSYLRSPMSVSSGAGKAPEVDKVFPYHAQEPGVQFLPLPELDMVMHACNPSTGEVSVRESEVRGYPWLYIELDASLGSMRPCHRRNKNNRNYKKKPVNSGPCHLSAVKTVVPGGYSLPAILREG